MGFDVLKSCRSESKDGHFILHPRFLVYAFGIRVAESHYELSSTGGDRDTPRLFETRISRSGRDIQGERNAVDEVIVFEGEIGFILDGRSLRPGKLLFF